MVQPDLGLPGHPEISVIGNLAAAQSHALGRGEPHLAARALAFFGLLAWLFWQFAHVYFLIGFRNRLVVLLDWAWAYWSFQRYARVVTGTELPGPEAPPSS